MDSIFTRRLFLSSFSGVALCAVAPSFAASKTSSGFDSPTSPVGITTPLGPISMVDGLGFAMSIVGAIAQADANRKILSRLSVINRKLDAILLSQQEILREIRDLRLYITKALFEQFQIETEIRIRAYMARYAVYATADFRNTPRDELNTLANDLLDSANIAGDCDFSAFPTFMLAASSSLALRSVTGLPNLERRKMADIFIAKLRDWRDPANPRSVVKAQEESLNRCTALRNELDAYRAEIRVSRPVWRSVKGQDECEFFNVLQVAGDFETGFRPGTVIERQGTCRREQTRDPGDSIGDRMGGSRGGFLSLSTPASAPHSPDYGGIPPTRTDSVGIPEIDSQNATRNTLIEEMRRGRNLAYVKAMIEQAERAIGAL